MRLAGSIVTGGGGVAAGKISDQTKVDGNLAWAMRISRRYFRMVSLFLVITMTTCSAISGPEHMVNAVSIECSVLALSSVGNDRMTSR